MFIWIRRRTLNLARTLLVIAGLGLIAQIPLAYNPAPTPVPPGELLPWKEVKGLFSLNATATVVDFQTGLSFGVIRRGGSLHADVQPITFADTQVMKEIYKGVWSWDRRAIVLELDGRRIAGSMNGMPHGAGALWENEFSGHFCIHFWGSQTHGGRMDPWHQLEMIRAAGGVFLALRRDD